MMATFGFDITSKNLQSWTQHTIDSMDHPVRTLNIKCRSSESNNRLITRLINNFGTARHVDSTVLHKIGRAHV